MAAARFLILALAAVAWVGFGCAPDETPITSTAVAGSSPKKEEATSERPTTQAVAPRGERDTVPAPAQQAAVGTPRGDVKPGAFSRSYLRPPELQFSCVRPDFPEQGYAELLADAKVDPDERLTAAKALWRGQSRRYAADVLKFLAGPSPGGEPFRVFQREVEASVRPEAILRELREGDYLWSTWLAFLRSILPA